MDKPTDINEFAKRLSALADLSIVQAKEFLEAQAILAVIDCVENSQISIPLIGNLSVTHTGDKVDAEGKKAQLDTEFKADKFLRKSIGQSADGKRTEAEALYQKKMENHLTKISTL